MQRNHATSRDGMCAEDARLLSCRTSTHSLPENRGARRIVRQKLLASVIALASACPAMAQEAGIDLSGRFDIGVRNYPEDGSWPGMARAGTYPFYGLQLEGGLSYGATEFVFEYSGILDPHTDQSTSNLQKAYLFHAFDSWDVLAGVNIENWGVSSSGRSIVNVLNAQDEVNTITGGSLIGTPMINANVTTDIGTFSAYLLPSEVEDNFGGTASRSRGPLRTEPDLAFYEREEDVDFALRYSNNFPVGAGALDIGVAYFQGSNRDPLLLAGCSGANGLVTEAVCAQITEAFRNDYLAGNAPPGSLEEGAAFVIANFGLAVALDSVPVLAFSPYYQDMRQLGLTAVYANGDTQLRFEGILRDTRFERFGAAIVGAERRFYGLFDPDDEITLAVEYHYDGRGPMQPTTIFEDDAFFGLLYQANDRNATRAEIGLFYDLDTDAQLYSLSASRRIGDRFRAEFNARYIEATGTGDPLAGIDNGTFFEFTLSTFF